MWRNQNTLAPLSGDVDYAAISQKATKIDRQFAISSPLTTLAITKGKVPGYSKGHDDGWNEAVVGWTSAVHQANATIGQLQAEKQALLGRVTTLEAQLQKLQQQLSARDVALDAYKKNNELWREAYAKLEARHKEMAQAIAVLQSALETSRASVQTLEFSAEEKRKEYNELIETYNELNLRNNLNIAVIYTLSHTLESVIGKDEVIEAHAAQTFAGYYQKIMDEGLSKGFFKPDQDHTQIAKDMPHTAQLMQRLLKVNQDLEYEYNPTL
jgi:chromosome segregation ATPase